MDTLIFNFESYEQVGLIESIAQDARNYFTELNTGGLLHFEAVVKSMLTYTDVEIPWVDALKMLARNRFKCSVSQDNGLQFSK